MNYTTKNYYYTQFSNAPVASHHLYSPAILLPAAETSSAKSSSGGGFSFDVSQNQVQEIDGDSNKYFESVVVDLDFPKSILDYSDAAKKIELVIDIMVAMELIPSVFVASLLFGIGNRAWLFTMLVTSYKSKVMIVCHIAIRSPFPFKNIVRY
jgi:hypothetical protein